MNISYLDCVLASKEHGRCGGDISWYEVVNLREWKFYKKIVTERPHQTIWVYDIIKTNNYLWMVESCVGVTPRPTQKGASKTLFQLGLVVSVINTLRRGLLYRVNGYSLC